MRLDLDMFLKDEVRRIHLIKIVSPIFITLKMHIKNIFFHMVYFAQPISYMSCMYRLYVEPLIGIMMLLDL